MPRFGDVVPTTQGRIDPTSILGGSVIDTNGGTIITIPAGKVWKGSVSLGGSHTASADWVSSISVQGTGATPSSGTTICAISGSIVGVLVNGVYSPGAVSVSDVYIAAPSGNTVTLQLDNPAAASAIGSAVGLIL